MKQLWEKHWTEKAASDFFDIINRDPYYRLLKRLIELPEDRKLKIIEIGCGSGARTLSLLKEFPSFRLDVILVDYSKTALRYAQKNAEKNKVVANFVLADAFNLPFSRETFDIAWNEGVNEHFVGLKRFLIFEEMIRVAKERGQVIVIVPNALNIPYQMRKRILQSLRSWEYGFEKPFSIFELKNILESLNTIPVKFGGVIVLTSFLELMPTKVVIDKILSGKVKKQSGGLRARMVGIEIDIENIFGCILGRNIGITVIKVKQK